MCVDPNSEICLAANFFKVWKCCFWHRYIKLQQKNRLELLLQVAGQATVYPLIATCTLIDSCFYGHHINPFYLCLYVRANGQYNILWQATWTVVCPPVVYGASLTFKSTVEKWNSIKGNTVCSSSILQLHSCFDYVTAPTAKWAQPQACWGLGLTSVLEGLMKLWPATKQWHTAPSCRFNGLHPRYPCHYMDFYSFSDAEWMAWLTHSGRFTHKVVTCRP